MLGSALLGTGVAPVLVAALALLRPGLAARFDGPIQLATWLCFVVAETLLLLRQLRVTADRRGFGFELLPAPQVANLYPETAIELRRRLRLLPPRDRKLFVVRLLQACLLRSRTEWSQDGAAAALRGELEVIEREIDGGDAAQRYLSWAMPTLGFVGTVLGIGKAIGTMRDIAASDLIARATPHLSTAFDTTFVALVLGLGHMLHWHWVQATEDALLTRAHQHAHEGFVCRMCGPRGPGHLQ